MIHLFVDKNALGALARRDFCKNAAKRVNWIVDIVDIPVTQTVEFDAQKKRYRVTESYRDDQGGRSYKTGKSMCDVSIAEADDILGWLEIIQHRDERTSVITGLLIARQAENFLHETGFWNSNEVPDEKTGGIFITVEGKSLIAKVVYGQERPDMLCIPFRVHLRDIGYVVEDGKPEMGRPYGDEFIRRLTKR